MEDRNQSDRIFSYIDEQKNMGKTVAEEDIEDDNSTFKKTSDGYERERRFN